MKLSKKRPSRSGIYVVFNKTYKKYELVFLKYLVKENFWVISTYPYSQTTEIVEKEDPNLLWGNERYIETTEKENNETATSK